MVAFLSLEPISSSKGLSVSYPVERVAEKSGRGLTCVENTKCYVLVKKNRYTALLHSLHGWHAVRNGATNVAWLAPGVCRQEKRYGRRCQELVGTCL